MPVLVQSQNITVRDQLTLHAVDGVLFERKTLALRLLTSVQGAVDLTPFASSDTIFISHLAYGAIAITRAELERLGGTLYLVQRAISLDEFVLSANRFLEHKRDVPEQLTLIKRRDIGLLDQQSTGDLLQNSGMLFVQKSQMGGGSPVIRGFESSRVLLVVDGVRMNNAIYRAGHLQDIMTVDQNSLERIEVISGPASVAYGSDALGGVIHMMTRSPAFNDTAGIAVGGAAFFRHSTVNEEKTAHVDFSFSTRRISSFTSISASDFGDLRQGNRRDSRYPEFGLRTFSIERQGTTDVVVLNPDPDVQLGTGYKQLDVLEKVRLRTGARTVHQINVQLSTSSNVPRYDRLSEYTLDSIGAIVPAQAEWYYGPQKRLLAAYTLELEKRGFFDQARITPSYQFIEQSRHNRGFGSSRLGSRVEKVAMYGLNADFEKRIYRHEVRYGLEMYLNDVGSQAQRQQVQTGDVSYLTTRYPNGGSTMASHAAYVTHTYELNKRWVFSEGLRYTYVALQSTFADEADYQFLNGTVEQRNGAFNWRAGAICMPGLEWRFSALGSTGFRAPNVDDLGKVFDSSPSRVVVPNPDLKPERTVNAEIGVSKVFCARYTVELNAFHTWLHDALVIADSRSNGKDSIVYDGTLSRVTTLTNKDQAYIYGGSGRFTARFDDHFSLSSGITYTYGRVHTDSTDAPLVHIAPLFGRTGLEFQMKRLRGEVYALYNGWKHLHDYSNSGEDNIQYATVDGMPACATVNVRCSLAFTQHVTLQVAVENITDANYRTFASGVSGPGRNLQVSLRATF